MPEICAELHGQLDSEAPCLNCVLSPGAGPVSIGSLATGWPPTFDQSRLPATFGQKLPSISNPCPGTPRGTTKLGLACCSLHGGSAAAPAAAGRVLDAACGRTGPVVVVVA